MGTLAVKFGENSEKVFVEHQDLFNFLIPLSDAYPGIENWLGGKVLPGLSAETRHVVRVERDGNLAAIGIAKNEGGEKKLCTIRVAPSYANLGIGIRILDNLLEWLDTRSPLVTVSEEKMPAFSRIFDRYGFVLTSVQTGIYRPGKAEYFFNETSSPLLKNN